MLASISTGGLWSLHFQLRSNSRRGHRASIDVIDPSRLQTRLSRPGAPRPSGAQTSRKPSPGTTGVTVGESDPTSPNSGEWARRLEREKMEPREPHNRILGIVGDLLSRHGGSNSSSSASAGRSLSPGDESRFVPRPSSSGLAKEAGEEAGSGDSKPSGERRAAGVATESSEAKGGVVPPGEDDGRGIVGATVCFTPEPSLPSSPRLLGRDSRRNGSGGGSGGAGSSSVDGVHRASMATSRMTSSAMHVASSLDGRSTTEYEMLDGTSSKGSLNVGCLILEAEDDAIGVGLVAAMKEELSGTGEGKGAEDEESFERAMIMIDTAASMSTLSPCGTVPSLNQTPFAMFKTSHQSGTKPPSLPDVKALPSPARLEPLAPEPSPGAKNLGKGSDDFGGVEALEKAAVDLILEGESGGLEASPDVEASPSPARLDPVALESKSGSVDTGKGNEDSGGDDASKKAGDMPSTPSVDRNYWEGQFGFVDAKGAIAPSLHADALRGGNRIGLGVSEDSSPETPGVAAEPSGRAADGTEVANQDAGGADPDIPKSVAFAFLRGAASFALSMLAIFGMFLRGKFDSLQRFARATVKMFFAQILHQNVAGTNAIGSAETPKAEIEKEEDGCDDPPESEGVNLMKFFSDEVLGAEGSSAPRIETYDGKGRSTSDVSTLGQGCTGKDVAKRNKALSVSKSIKVALGALIPAAFVLYNRMVQHGVRVAQSGSIDQSQNETVDRLAICPIPLWEITLASTPPQASGVKYSDKLEVEDDQASNKDLRCFLTNTTSFLSVPFAEINLLPTPFEPAEEEFVQPHDLAGSISWLSAFVLVSIVISLREFVFKSKISFPFIRPNARPPSGANADAVAGKLTGMWTRDEHEQFLRGYEVHGKRWKLVSAFVPTRSEKQVRSHGGYWLKMRSPEKMKRSRKATPAPNDTPKRRGTATCSSSSKVTPKQSNETGARVEGGKPVPLQGILLEKDNNSMYKHVTPRSEGRTRRMKNRSGGCKSDPGTKRVRIVAP